MPTPFIHTATGAFAVGAIELVTQRKLQTRDRLLLLIAPNLPDLDFIPGLFTGKLFQFHHQGAHSFLGAAILALILGRFFKKSFLVGWGILLALAHPILDLTIVDVHNVWHRPPGWVHEGLPLFWPFTENRTPVFFHLFNSSYFGTNIDYLLAKENVASWTFEMCIFMTSIVFAWSAGRFFIPRQRASMLTSPEV